MHLERRKLFASSRSEYIGIMNQCMNTDSQLRNADHFVDIATILRNIKVDEIMRMVEVNTPLVAEVIDGVRELRGELTDSNHAVAKEHRKLQKPEGRHARVLEDIFGPPSDQPGILPILPIPAELVFT